ncbi:monoglyceride lipase-like [Dermacentor albipictus]|uniref:monoglyceride lipase-like n=1 Tax=Dermacentor albipictus TaxID=60249 RepID=UPI0031FCCB14
MSASPTASSQIVRVDDNVSFLNSGGQNIVCKSWSADAEPRALVFLAHGYAEHCHDPSYDALARALVGLGCYVFAHDHVGHGKSEGPRATVTSADVYVDDILSHVDTVRAKFSGKPVYLVGYSMGGLLVVRAVQRRPKDFAGMVLLAPLLGVEQVSWFKANLVRVLGRLLPSLPVAKTAVELACRDPAAIKQMNDDPLRYRGNVSAGWAAAIFSALEAAHAQVNVLELPIFIQHGSGDKLCDPDASFGFFKNAPSKDKSIKIYSDAYHSLLKEPEGVGQQALKDIVNWCSSRIPTEDTPTAQPHLSGEQQSHAATLTAMLSNA